MNNFVDIMPDYLQKKLINGVRIISCPTSVLASLSSVCQKTNEKSCLKKVVQLLFILSPKGVEKSIKIWQNKNGETRKKHLIYLKECVILGNGENLYGGSQVTGVPPSLQNQCRALGASWVGSIPTCPRQKSVKLQTISINEIKSREKHAIDKE